MGPDHQFGEARNPLSHEPGSTKPNQTAKQRVDGFNQNDVQVRTNEAAIRTTALIHRITSDNKASLMSPPAPRCSSGSTNVTSPNQQHQTSAVLSKVAAPATLSTQCGSADTARKNQQRPRVVCQSGEDACDHVPHEFIWHAFWSRVSLCWALVTSLARPEHKRAQVRPNRIERRNSALTGVQPKQRTTLKRRCSAASPATMNLRSFSYQRHGAHLEEQCLHDYWTPGHLSRQTSAGSWKGSGTSESIYAVRVLLARQCDKPSAPTRTVGLDFEKLFDNVQHDLIYQARFLITRRPRNIRPTGQADHNQSR